MKVTFIVTLALAVLAAATLDHEMQSKDVLARQWKRDSNNNWFSRVNSWMRKWMQNWGKHGGWGLASPAPSSGPVRTFTEADTITTTKMVCGRWNGCYQSVYTTLVNPRTFTETVIIHTTTAPCQNGGGNCVIATPSQSVAPVVGTQTSTSALTTTTQACYFGFCGSPYTVTYTTTVTVTVTYTATATQTLAPITSPLDASATLTPISSPESTTEAASPTSDDDGFVASTLTEDLASTPPAISASLSDSFDESTLTSSGNPASVTASDASASSVISSIQSSASAALSDLPSTDSSVLSSISSAAQSAILSALDPGEPLSGSAISALLSIPTSLPATPLTVPNTVPSLGLTLTLSVGSSTLVVPPSSTLTTSLRSASTIPTASMSTSSVGPVISGLTSTKGSSTRASSSTTTARSSTTASRSTTTSAVAKATQTINVTGLTYQNAMLTVHNAHRSNHSLAALVWDQSLTAIAASIAATCVYGHNVTAGGGGYGQNIGAGAAGNAAAGLITNLMYNGEINYYPTPYGNDNPDLSNFHLWGHYSQLVWASTTNVGCFTQYCPQGLANTGTGVQPYFTVCNYSPPGNYVGEFSQVAAPKGGATVVVVGS